MENLNVDLKPDMGSQSAATGKRNFLQKAAGVVFSPVETMKYIVAKPSVLFPIILIVVISLISTAVLILNYDAYKDFTIKLLQDTYANMGMEVPNESLDFTANLSLKFGFAAQPVLMVGMWLIGTLILFAAVKIFKGQGKLKQYIGVTGYAYVITFISTLVTSAIILYTGNFSLVATGKSTGMASITSLATLLPQSMGGTFLFAFAGCLEIFSIWQYIVVGIGVAEVGKFSYKKAFLIVGAIFVLNALYVSGSASLTSLMGNIGR